MMKFVSTLAAAAALCVSFNASAQEPVVTGGEVRAPSPRIMDPDRPGYFQVGVGPSFALGLDSDAVMYNVVGAYNRNISDRLTGKIFGDFNLGTGADAAQFINVGLGTDIYLQEVRMDYGVPYLMADVGYGFVRDEDTQTQDAAVIGAGAGFKMAAEALNFDLNVHYSLLTAQLDGKTPSILGLRAAVNF